MGFPRFVRYYGEAAHYAVRRVISGCERTGCGMNLVNNPMTNIHNTVGGLLLVAYIATTIIYALGIGSGRIPAFGRAVSGVASVLLLAQYLLGIGLLAARYQNVWYHYLLAVLVLLPIGLEHGFLRRRFTGRQLATNLTGVAAVTTVVILLTYLVGLSNRGG